MGLNSLILVAFIIIENIVYVTWFLATVNSLYSDLHFFVYFQIYDYKERTWIELMVISLDFHILFISSRCT